MRYLTAVLIGLLVTPCCFAGETGANDGAKFAELEKRTGGRIGVVAVDNAKNTRVEYHADERFLMCSTFKVLAVAAVLKRVDENKEQLDRFVRYGEAQLLAYAPVTREHVKEGGMTMEALCAAAISQSDNTAANLILETFGGPATWTELARSLGDKMSRLDHNEPELNVARPGKDDDTTTPAAMCADLQRLFTSDFLTAASRMKLEGWMQQNETGLQLIRANIPADWKVGDKTGRSGNGETNDIAILRPPSGGPIFIAVYTSCPGSKPEEQNKLIGDATRIALDALKK